MVGANSFDKILQGCCDPEKLFIANGRSSHHFHFAFSPSSTRQQAAAYSHPLPLWREELTRLGSGGIRGCRTGGSKSGLVTACLCRVNTRPKKPIATKTAPAIISQCGNLIDDSKSIYFPFAFLDQLIVFDRVGLRLRLLPAGMAARPRPKVRRL